MTRLVATLLVGAVALGAGSCGAAWAASPDDTRIAGPGAAIIDGTGATWTLSNGVISVDGVRDKTSFNVVCVAYEDGHVWQENTGHTWFRKTKPSDVWAPSQGTTDSPLPAITATVSAGALRIRTDPQTVVGITALAANDTAKGSISHLSDNSGQLAVPTSALFGAGTYLVSAFRRPLLLSGKGNIAMFSLEHYTTDYQYTDGYLSDLYDRYGPGVGPLEWTSLTALQQADPAAFAAFAASLGHDQAYIYYKGSAVAPNYLGYVARTTATSTTIASIANVLFLDTDSIHTARVAYSNKDPAGYAFDTVASVNVAVP